ncbi:bacteriohemerythrin [Hydrogenophaga sp.]|uniref:bacteriohemerythrin n=1 Tax=Hydrogenophaga sp. TaxID=1904254 RepID=UPI003F6FC115
MTSSLNLGDPVLDEDHARLLHLADQLLKAPSGGAVPSLEALRAHAAEHFAVEDLELHTMQDGNTQCHLDEHAAVLRSLDEVREVLLQEGTPTEAKDSLVRRLATQLREWLPEHVQAMDAGVATHRMRRRFGGAPVKISRQKIGQENAKP